MAMNNKKIKWPECSESNSIDDVLTHQIEEKIKEELQAENKLKRNEIAKEKKELDKQKGDLEMAQKNAQIEVNKKVNEKLVQRGWVSK